MNKDILAKATELRHELHMHPELSYQEVWTKQRLMDFLKDPSKEFSLRKLGGLVKILETFKTIEPSLEGILQAAIAKFNNLAK